MTVISDVEHRENEVQNMCHNINLCASKIGMTDSLFNKLSDLLAQYTNTGNKESLDKADKLYQAFVYPKLLGYKQDSQSISFELETLRRQ